MMDDFDSGDYEINETCFFKNETNKSWDFEYQLDSNFPFYGPIAAKLTFYHPFGQIDSCIFRFDVRKPDHFDESDPNYCLSGRGLVLMANGSYKCVNQLSVGDLVKTMNNAGNLVTGVVEIVSINTLRPHYSGLVKLENDLIVTAGHPIFTSSGWIRASQCPHSSRGVFPEVSAVYNFVLDSRSSLFVNGTQVSTLGQFCIGIDDENSYFGSERVVQYLKSIQVAIT